MKLNKNKIFHDKILNTLVEFGPITSRAMFGGFGIYYEGVIFALIIENELYFRIDEHTKPDFEKYKDSHPFTYMGAKKSVTLPYMTLPNAILKDKTQLQTWIINAHQASLRNKMKKKPKRKKNTIE